VLRRQYLCSLKTGWRGGDNIPAESVAAGVGFATRSWAAQLVQSRIGAAPAKAGA